MENKMAEVAKLLGLKLEEEFTIKGVNSSYRFKLTAAGLMSSWRNSSKWNSSGLLEEFITGHYQISKEKANSVLDPAEKRYLSQVIKPFRSRVNWIRKQYLSCYEFIQICVFNGDEALDWMTFNLPYFKRGTMYQGMEIDKRYTIQQLGL